MVEKAKKVKHIATNIEPTFKPKSLLVKMLAIAVDTRLLKPSPLIAAVLITGQPSFLERSSVSITVCCLSFLSLLLSAIYARDQAKGLTPFGTPYKFGQLFRLLVHRECDFLLFQKRHNHTHTSVARYRILSFCIHG